MTTLRNATPQDAALITEQRHKMFGDNGFGSESALDAADARFEPWVRERLQDGRYVGLLLEEEGKVVAGAGIFFADFPPHWMDPQPLRAYVLNVYTSPESRGKGYAKRLMAAVLEECGKRGVPTVVLHASPMGKPVYEGMSFKATDEMMLRLDARSVGETNG
jgi:GNAT superfamily N-acetyltransferase